MPLFTLQKKKSKQGKRFTLHLMQKILILLSEYNEIFEALYRIMLMHIYWSSSGVTVNLDFK